MYDLYKITRASALREIRSRVFEVFKDDFRVIKPRVELSRQLIARR